MEACMETDCNIYHTGEISCTHPCEHSATCEYVDYKYWPFDTQNCHYEYVSMTSGLSKLNFINHTVVVDLLDGFETNQWRLKEASSFSGFDTYDVDGFNEIHPYVWLDLSIERRNAGYMKQIMIPAIVMCVCNLFTLLLSTESSERIWLFVINFCSYNLYIEQIRWM